MYTLNNVQNPDAKLPNSTEMFALTWAEMLALSYLIYFLSTARIIWDVEL